MPPKRAREPRAVRAKLSGTVELPVKDFRRSVSKQRSIASPSGGALKGKAASSGALSAVRINRAPVLTLWMEVCLNRLGYSSAASLSAAKVIAARCAVAKGRALGMIPPRGEVAKKPGAEVAATRTAPVSEVRVAGHVVPLVSNASGVLVAASFGSSSPQDPAQVERYLKTAFKDDLDTVRAHMSTAARSYPKEELRKNAMHLYESFRPAWRGWGVPSELQLEDIDAVCK